MTEKIKKPLVGKFFHSFYLDGEVKKVELQGRVVDQINDNFFLVECFSWIHGGGNWGLDMMELKDMKDWKFYESSEEMKEAYEVKYEKREK